MADPVPLLVVSLGNPPPYANTLHSAGHLLLPAVAQALAPAAPPLGAHAHYRGGRAAADAAASPHAFFQPSASMNVLGPSVAAAWRAFRRGLPCAADTGRARLVLLHDELELPLGRVRRRAGASSAKGHNGLKSVGQALGGALGPVVRVGVGIGRPESRDLAAVSAHVLRKVAPQERAVLEAAVGDVVEVLRQLEAGEGEGGGVAGKKSSQRRM